MKVALISCVSRKAEESKSKGVSAKDLYISALFKKSWKYAIDILEVDKIYILSAEHHLLKPDEEVLWYDKTLVKCKKKDLIEWSRIVLAQMEKENLDFENDEFYILAGSNYHKYLITDKFKNVCFPLQRYPIGLRLQFLTQQIDSIK